MCLSLQDTRQLCPRYRWCLLLLAVLLVEVLDVTRVLQIRTRRLALMTAEFVEVMFSLRVAAVCHLQLEQA